VEGRLIWARVDRDGEAGEGAALVVPWWSVTKTVIAAAALRLAERGALDLDAPLEAAHGASLRAVLQHRAALPDYGSLPDYHAAVAAGEPPWSEAGLLARVGGPTDGRWRYSNVGYLLARRQVEAAAGAPLGTALKTLVLEPLGLGERVRLAETPADMAATALPPPAGYHPGWVYHGCLIGPVAAAARAMAGVLGGLLGPEATAAMAAAIPVGGALPGRPWRRTGYGLGLMLGTMADADGVMTSALGHSGGGPGSACAVYRFPERPDAPTVAVFGALADPGAAESRARALA
jgi:CubicO group peptidase (beta-lactamase class C family)